MRSTSLPTAAQCNGRSHVLDTVSGQCVAVEFAPESKHGVCRTHGLNCLTILTLVDMPSAAAATFVADVLLPGSIQVLCLQG